MTVEALTLLLYRLECIATRLKKNGVTVFLTKMTVLYLKGLKKDAIKAKLSDKTSFNGKLFSHQLFCEQVVNLLPGQPAVITNGRVSNFSQ